MNVTDIVIISFFLRTQVNSAFSLNSGLYEILSYDFTPLYFSEILRNKMFAFDSKTINVFRSQ